MVHITELPLDILSLIIIMLATSTDGARHLARFAATCKQFRQYPNKYHVLKVVRFRQLASTHDYTRHHHPRDLLWVCAHKGNRAAKVILAKAILYKDAWFQQMLEDNNQDVADFGVAYYGSELLHSHELVREFICYASNIEILWMQYDLLKYVISSVGYKVADIFGILSAIKKMCSRIEVRPFDTLGNDGHNADREEVLVIFDKLFHTKPVELWDFK